MRSDSPTPEDVGPDLPKTVGEGGSPSMRRRRRFQFPLLVGALVGIAFAGWYARDNWMHIRRLWDPLYGDPLHEAFRRYPLAEATVPEELISVGNVNKDGIPALVNPPMLAATDAAQMRPDDRVIGVSIGGLPRAYPLKILEWHEVVNDDLAGVPIAVTYCPLCDSSIVFDRRAVFQDDPVEFGVSGLLYNSNVIFYNRTSSEEESLWSQMGRTSILGPQTGRELPVLPLEVTTWADWRARHPDTQVLSPQTGHRLDYSGISPYADYFAGKLPMPLFAVEPFAPTDRLGWLDPVLGAWTADRAVAVPVEAFTEQDATTIELGTSSLTVVSNPGAGTLRVVDQEGDVHWMYAAWFAWYAFQPQTEIYEPRAGATP